MAKDLEQQLKFLVLAVIHGLFGRISVVKLNALTMSGWPAFVLTYQIPPNSLKDFITVKKNSPLLMTFPA